MIGFVWEVLALLIFVIYFYTKLTGEDAGQNLMVLVGLIVFCCVVMGLQYLVIGMREGWETARTSPKKAFETHRRMDK